MFHPIKNELTANLVIQLCNKTLIMLKRLQNIDHENFSCEAFDFRIDRNHKWETYPALTVKFFEHNSNPYSYSFAWNGLEYGGHVLSDIKDFDVSIPIPVYFDPDSKEETFVDGLDNFIAIERRVFDKIEQLIADQLQLEISENEGMKS